MSFLEFLGMHWSSILVVAAVIVVCIVLIKKGYSKYVKEIVFYLVCEAESVYGNGTGELKYAAVTSWLYDKLPAIVKVFFSAKEIDSMIEAAVEEMKQWLSSNEEANALIVEKQK